MDTVEIGVFEDKLFPGDWRVEWIGKDGGCYVTIFSGPLAKERAEQYGRWETVQELAGVSE